MVSSKAVPEMCISGVSSRESILLVEDCEGSMMSQKDAYSGGGKGSCHNFIGQLT